MNKSFHSSKIHRVLILGHNGFVGTRLSEYFHEQLPETEIIGRSLPRCDLTRLDNVLALKDYFDPETAVIMLSGIKKQLGDTLEIFSQNIKMVVNICKLLQDHPVRRFVFFSSAEVYGEDIHNTKITEDTPVNLSSFYGMAKYASEGLLRKVVNSGRNGSLLILRPPLVYGPGDISKGYGPSGFVRDAVSGKDIVLWGDGSELREFLFLDDLVNIVYRLTFHEYNGEINVASGISYSFRDTLEIVSSLGQINLNISSRSRTRQKVDNVFCNDLLSKLLPDISFTGLKEGIKRTFNSEHQAMAESDIMAEGAT